VQALAAAPSEDVMAAWAGLGYYSRARRLVECAGVVAGMGDFPQDEAGLRALPGLGAYTAAAVAAIAFGVRAVVVDGNVERVVSRLFAIDTPLPAAKGEICEGADLLTPADHPGDFAQAMMDLGATVCTPRSPKCLICPVAPWCAARVSGAPETYPVKPPKTAKPARQGTAWWIERDGAQGREVWLVRREGKGLLGGCALCPTMAGSRARMEPASRHLPQRGARSARLPMFSRIFRWLCRCRPSICPPPAMGEGEWWPVDRLDDAGLPTVFARAAARAMAVFETEPE
jgi:A/G-specific adenine glycosylase